VGGNLDYARNHAKQYPDMYPNERGTSVWGRSVRLISMYGEKRGERDCVHEKRLGCGGVVDGRSFDNSVKEKKNCKKIWMQGVTELVMARERHTSKQPG